MITTLGLVAFYATALGFVAFVILYLFSQWWRTPIGRNAMTMMGLFAVLMSLGVMNRVWPEWFAAHRAIIILISYSALAVVVWWRVVSLWRIEDAFR